MNQVDDSFQPVTAENFQPMTEEEIEYRWKADPALHADFGSLEAYAKEVRDEEESVRVLIGLGFNIVKKVVE